jgi:hypothetical protein
MARLDQERQQLAKEAAALPAPPDPVPVPQGPPEPATAQKGPPTTAGECLRPLYF